MGLHAQRPWRQRFMTVPLGTPNGRVDGHLRRESIAVSWTAVAAPLQKSRSSSTIVAAMTPAPGPLARNSIVVNLRAVVVRRPEHPRSTIAPMASTIGPMSGVQERDSGVVSWRAVGAPPARGHHCLSIATSAISIGLGAGVWARRLGVASTRVSAVPARGARSSTIALTAWMLGGQLGQAIRKIGVAKITARAVPMRQAHTHRRLLSPSIASSSFRVTSRRGQMNERVGAVRRRA
mmetsp:Transcript_87000/g.186401  ORF Transcript_87000/g.186401 Transcript_87000/m.186401 type:complete len:236 (-) Transcript_87000:303-1010(-)